MEEFEGSRFEASGSTFKRKRTQTYRRPKPEVSELPENHDQESLSSTPPSDDGGKISSDENGVDANPKRKVFNLNQCATRKESDNLNKGYDNALYTNGGSIDAREGGNEKKLKKVKLKFGGVTRTIQPKSKSNSDEDDSSSVDKKIGLQGIPWKDFSKVGFIIGKETEKNEESDGARRSRRAPKKRVLDGDFVEYDDDEIRYLEKLKTSKVAASRDSDDDSSKKHKSLSKVFEEGPSPLRSGKDSVSIDTDYEEEDSVSTNVTKWETTLTSRQRALLSGRDSASAATQIEFPNGLPPVAPRKQKEKLTELEQQLKKAEAAERRRIQNEKAARESEAEAIRKILGQDSSRKKREDKLKKRQQELAQEKAANAKTLAPNTIRTVIGPTGTTVAFAQDIGLPHIFDPKPSCYPPSREKCAGPSCTNAYKYRDSKSKLPLCSLECYKAVHERMQAETCC